MSIMKALSLLATESWDTERPSERDHWRELAVKGRAELDALRAENAELKEKVSEIVKLLEFNGCECACDCDCDGHISEDCNPCFACEVNDLLQPEFARPKPGAGT